MEEIIELLEKFVENEKLSEDKEEEMKISLNLLGMALTADESKINALGHSVDLLCQMQEFTPFEVCATCASLIAGACKEQLIISDRDTANAFYKHVLDTLERTIEKALEDKSDECEDGDCTCKCE